MKPYSGCRVYVCLFTVFAFLSVSAALPGSVEPASAPVGAIASPGSLAAASASSVSVSPTSIVGGDVATGQVFLSAPAPKGGAQVTLSSNSPFVSLPASLKIRNRAISGSFSITTTQVTALTTVTISASYGATVSTSLTLLVSTTAISSVAVAPTTVVGGTTAQGTASLTAPAPAGGLVVALASDNSSVASVPPSVTVPAGSASANFTVTTNQVGSSVSDTISATYGGTASTSLTIMPAATALSSVSLNPTTVVGGSNTQGTVTLTGAAPTGGANVSLASDNPSVASVPSSVTVPAGSTSASFSVTTSTVVASTSATISATYGATASASLTVLPAATALSSVSLNPTTVVGGTSSQGTANLTGAAPAGGANVSLASDNPSVASVPSSVTVPAGSSSATVTIITNPVLNTTSAMISGTYAGATSGSSLTVQPQSSGAQFYVSPTGSPSGDGSLGNPWDFQTALNQTALVQPGATINLRGGVYTGHFTSRIVGSASNPITVRAYPGETPKLDGYLRTTLAQSISNSVTTIVLTDGTGFTQGNEVIIDNGQGAMLGEDMYLGAKSGGTFINSIRGWFGTTPTSHNAGELVVQTGHVLDIQGSDVVFRDLDIYNSDPARVQFVEDSQSGPHKRGFAVNISGARTKLINCSVHDQGNGVFQNPSAVDSEVYGCIIYNNGYIFQTLGHGHGLYIQNSTGSFKVTNCIVFNNFHDGIKPTSLSGDAINVILNGNIVFNSGSPTSLVPGADPRQRYPNTIIGANNGTVDGCEIKNSCYYHPQDSYGGNIKLGYQGTNGSIALTNNYIAGGTQQIQISYFTPLTVTGNTIYVGNNSTPAVYNTFLLHYSNTTGQIATIDNNTYHNSYWNTTQNYNNAFYLNEASQNFAQWKASGFDANSTHSGTSASYRPPNYTRIFSNAYDSKRWHLAIYNWSLANSVSVDVSSILNNGDQYAVYAAEDYFGSPVAIGTYSSGSILVPMTGTNVVRPIGYAFTPATTRREFGAFVILKTN